MDKRLVAAAAALALVGALAGSSLAHRTARPRTSTAASGGGFTARVDNPWFPLVPGTRLLYTGVKDGARTRDVVNPLRTTKVIDGAPCRAVHDNLYMHGYLAERTTDWYTQDRHGNVWYYGEATAELDANGNVTSTEGSWQAGVDGAKPGIFMPAHPRVGQSFRQEFLPGQAEDHFTIIGIFRPVVSIKGVGGKGSPGLLLTKEWTPLEPGVLDHKFYARGLGNVLEQSERGENERNELVAVRR